MSISTEQGAAGNEARRGWMAVLARAPREAMRTRTEDPSREERQQEPDRARDRPEPHAAAICTIEQRSERGRLARATFLVAEHNDVRVDDTWFPRFVATVLTDGDTGLTIT